MKCPNCYIELWKNGERLECSQCGFNNYPNQKVIDKIYVWVAVEKQSGCEGIIGLQGKMGAMPALSSDLELAKSVTSQLQPALKAMKQKGYLLEFDRVKIIEVIE